MNDFGWKTWKNISTNPIWVNERKAGKANKEDVPCYVKGLSKGFLMNRIKFPIKSNCKIQNTSLPNIPFIKGNKLPSNIERRFVFRSINIVR